jgi:hypothetical protein
VILLLLILFFMVRRVHGESIIAAGREGVEIGMGRCV